MAVKTPLNEITIVTSVWVLWRGRSVPWAAMNHLRNMARFERHATEVPNRRLLTFEKPAAYS